MTDFKLVSLNVRGLRSINKRKALFMWLTKQKADIVFLQETYSSIEDEKILEYAVERQNVIFTRLTP